MGRQTVDLVLSLPEDARRAAKMAAKQGAWLRATRIPLRRIKLAASGLPTDKHILKQQRASQQLAVSDRMLAASESTLEVLVPPYAGRCVRPHLAHCFSPQSASKNAFLPQVLPGCQAKRLGSDKFQANMQVIELEHLCVPMAPRHVTTLARFSELRVLSMSGLERLNADEVCHAALQTHGWYGLCSLQRRYLTDAD